MFGGCLYCYMNDKLFMFGGCLYCYMNDNSFLMFYYIYLRVGRHAIPMICPILFFAFIFWALSFLSPKAVTTVKISLY